MKTLSLILTKLATNLDTIGLNTYADAIDLLLKKAVIGEDFGELLNMFDEPIVLEVEEEESPGGRHKLHEEDEEVFVPVDEEETVNKRKSKENEPNRMDMLKRRHELLKLKKMLSKDEDEDAQEAAAEKARIDKEFESMEHAGVGKDIAKHLDEEFGADEEEEFEDEDNSLERPSKTVRERESGQLEQPYEKFEDEDENMADDDGFLSTLKGKLESVPELAKKLFTLIKENPELLQLILAV